MTGKNTPTKSHALWMPEKTSIMGKQLACQHGQKNSTTTDEELQVVNDRWERENELPPGMNSCLGGVSSGRVGI